MEIIKIRSMGCNDKGLGIHEQGILEPISIYKNDGYQGLGHTSPHKKYNDDNKMVVGDNSSNKSIKL